MSNLTEQIDAASAEKLQQADTPVIRQWQRFKQKYGNFIILFKVGDFYETFYDDARTLSQVTGAALTTRGKAGHLPVLMAGVPCDSVEKALKQLIAAGHRVALAEPTAGGKGCPSADEQDPERWDGLS